MASDDPPSACSHGGAFFDAIGDAFRTLDRRHDVVNADVLDAWFPPTPRAVAAVADHLEWLLATSPPTGCEGLVRTIAEVRGLAAACVLPGAGSSELIYLALRRMLTPSSRALVLDPTYGEYAHVLERVVGCRVDRIALRREDGWRVPADVLAARLREGHDLVVLVNPNSPTGVHCAREALEPVLRTAPERTCVWIDETYVDYAGEGESLERFAAASQRTVVCKSMSKAYGLSGARVAYLAGPAPLLADLRALTPPWAVGLIAQVAAVEALLDPAYYRARWAETRTLRAALTTELTSVLRADAAPASANFVLLHLPGDGPRPSEIVHAARARGVYVRDFPEMPALAESGLRVAVKDAASNARIVAALRAAVA